MQNIRKLTLVLLALSVFLIPTQLRAEGLSSSVFAVMAEMTGGTVITLPKPTEGEDDPTIQCAAFNIIMGTIKPTVTAVKPMKLPLGTTVNLLITAPSANFNHASTVRILQADERNSGIQINAIEFVSPSKIEANVTVPTTTARQFYDVYVDSPLGGDTETAKGACALEVIEKPANPLVLSVSPSKLTQNSTTAMDIYGSNTHFDTATPVLNLGNGITATNIVVHDPAFLTATLEVDETSPDGFRNVTVTTGAEVANDSQAGGSVLVLPSDLAIPLITEVSPLQVPRDNTVLITLTGSKTHFNSSSVVSVFGDGVAVDNNALSVENETQISAPVTIASDATFGYRDVSVTTGAETATIISGLEILPITHADIVFSGTNISEDAPNDTVIGKFSTTNSGVETAVYTHVLDDNAGGRFKLVGDDLQVADTSLLDAGKHSIVVRAIYLGNDAATKTFFIDVIHDGPTSIVISSDAVIEKSEVGTEVGVFSTVDPTLGDSHTYTLVDDAEGLFEIKDNRLLVANKEALVMKTYAIKVRSTDSTAKSIDKDFTIKVESPINVEPTKVELTNTVAKVGTSANTIIAKLSSIDPNSDDTHTYSLEDDADEFFGIDNDSLIANKELSEVAEHSITIRTTDNGGLFHDEDFTITVKDMTLDGNEIQVDSEAGTEIGQLDTQGSNKVHTYGLVKNGELITDFEAEPFKIEYDRLLVANAKSLKVSTHEITVRSMETDNENLFFDKGFTITVNSKEPVPPIDIEPPPTPVDIEPPPTPVKAQPTPTLDNIDNDSNDDSISADVEDITPNNGDGNKADTLDSEVNTIAVISQIQFGSDSEFVLDEYATSSTILSGSQVSGYLINIPVTRTLGKDGIVTVDYAINAIPGYDYIAIHPRDGTLTWADGDNNEQQISLFVVDEEPLNFRLILSNPSDNAKLGTLTQATITKPVIKPVTKEVKPPTPVCSDDPALSLTPAEQPLTLNLWDEPIELEISGGQNFDEQDKIHIAQSPDSEIVTLDSTFPATGGAQFTFTPKAEGTTQVIVKDCASQAVINITVKGCDPNHTVTTKPEEVTLLLGDEAPFLLRVTGDGEQREILDYPRSDIVDVESSFTENGDISFLLLTPVATGNGTITVGNTCNQTEIPITVIDCFDEPTTPLLVEKEEITLSIDEKYPIFLEVTGRQCNLNLNQTGESATGTLFSSGEGKKLLQIVPNEIGETEFVISDGYGGEVSVNVTVMSPPPSPCCVGMNKESSEFAVTAEFEGNFGVQGDDISVGVNFTLDARHVGKKGSLMLVILHHQTGQFFVADESTLQPWDGQLANLVSTKEYEKLSASIMTTKVLQFGSLPYPVVGNVSVYVAYYVDDEEIYVVNKLAPIAGLIPNSMGIKVNNMDMPSLEGQQYEPFNPLAHFAGDVTTDAGQTGNNLTIGQQEAVATALTITVDAKHKGQTANIHIVAAHSSTGQQFMYDGTTWQPLADIVEAAVVESHPKLPSELIISKPLNLAALPINSLVGQLTIWVGYSLVDEDNNTLIVFNGKAPLQLFVANGRGKTRDGHTINTTTNFALKLNVWDWMAEVLTPEVSQNNAVAVDFVIHVDPVDVEQAATLILIAQIDDKFFLHDGNNWQAWQGDLDGLITVATKSYKALPAILNDSHSLTLEALPLETFPAEVFIYVGYLLGNADFIHSLDTPLHLKVVEAGKDEDWCVFGCPVN